MEAEPLSASLSMSHTLFVWLRGGELVKHLLESLISVLFLGLAAPLVDWLQRDQHRRDTARDLKLYSDLLDLQRATGGGSEISELLAKAIALLRQSLEKDAAWNDDTTPRRSVSGQSYILARANLWDYLFSLLIPSLTCVFLFFAALSDHKDSELVASVIIAIGLFLVCVMICRWSARHFRRSLVRRLLQLPVTFFLSAVAAIMLGIVATRK